MAPHGDNAQVQFGTHLCFYGSMHGRSTRSIWNMFSFFFSLFLKTHAGTIHKSNWEHLLVLKALHVNDSWAQSGKPPWGGGGQGDPRGGDGGSNERPVNVKLLVTHVFNCLKVPESRKGPKKGKKGQKMPKRSEKCNKKTLKKNGIS